MKPRSLDKDMVAPLVRVLFMHNMQGTRNLFIVDVLPEVIYAMVKSICFLHFLRRELAGLRNNLETLNQPPTLQPRRLQR